MAHPILENLAAVLSPLAEQLGAERARELMSLIEAELNRRPLVMLAWKEKTYSGPKTDEQGNAVRDGDGHELYVQRTYTVEYRLGEKNPSDESATIFGLFTHEGTSPPGLVVFSFKDGEVDGKETTEYWADFVSSIDGWRGPVSAAALADYVEFLIGEEDDEEEPQGEPLETPPAHANGRA